MRRLNMRCVALAFAATIAQAVQVQAHITDWITVDNNGSASSNTITNVGNSTVIGGVEGYQAIGSFPTVTLSDGQYVEMTGTFQLLGRTTAAANDLQRLRDQIRFGLFRAPEGDAVQSANLTGYIIEHRSEVREVRTPIGAPATNQSPFVSARGTPIPGAFSTAADPSFGSGTGNTNYTESDLVAGVDVTFTATYRVARQGNLLDITGSIAGSPATINQSQSNPPGPGDGVFLEQFSVQDYDPAINLSGAGSDDFDFKFNRVGFLAGGNVDLNLANPTADFDANGIVEGADLTQWRGQFDAGAGGDADADGDTDGNDFLLWQQNLAKTRGAVVLSNVTVTQGMSPAASAVPEPASLSLLLAAGVGAWSSRRKHAS